MFFFASFYENLKVHPDNQWFFNPPKPSQPIKYPSESAQEYSAKLRNWQVQMDDVKKQNEKSFKRVGWRYIYNRLLKSNHFKKHNLTPIESIILSDFNEVVRVLSLQNAM